MIPVGTCLRSLLLWHVDLWHKIHFIVMGFGEGICSKLVFCILLLSLVFSAVC